MKEYRKKNCKSIIVATGVLALFYATSHATPSFAKDGMTVYKTVCQVCHGTGVMGAPRHGDKAGWVDRISKGIATLEKNAIKGFKGKKGIMPARGGRSTLSDDEVKAAVAYMVDAVK